MSHDALFEQHPVIRKKHTRDVKIQTKRSESKHDVAAVRSPKMHTPGLHPAFRPQRLHFSLHEGFEVVLRGKRVVLSLQLVTAQLYPHQVTQQRSENKHNVQDTSVSLTADFRVWRSHKSWAITANKIKSQHGMLL